MVAVVNSTYQTMPQVEALWTIFVSQPKSVRTAFERMLHAQQEAAKTKQQQAMVKKSLNNALSEMKAADAQGKKLPNARQLFA